jgi:hypothetical protein
LVNEESRVLTVKQSLTVKLRLTVWVASLSLLLSGCNALVNTFIPDQPVTNPFGLNNLLLTLVRPAPSSPSSKAATYSGGSSNSLSNLAPGAFGPTRPTGIEEQLGVAPDLTIASAFANNASDPQGVFPETLTLSKSTLSFTVRDGLGGASFDDVFESPLGLTFTLTKETCETNLSRTVCTYTLDKEIPLLQIQLLGEDFHTLFDFITAGGQPNTVSGSLNLELTGEFLPPLDSELRVILKTSGGTLKF